MKFLFVLRSYRWSVSSTSIMNLLLLGWMRWRLRSPFDFFFSHYRLKRYLWRSEKCASKSILSMDVCKYVPVVGSFCQDVRKIYSCTRWNLTLWTWRHGLLLDFFARFLVFVKLTDFSMWAFIRVDGLLDVSVYREFEKCLTCVTCILFIVFTYYADMDTITSSSETTAVAACHEDYHVRYSVLVHHQSVVNELGCIRRNSLKYP